MWLVGAVAGLMLCAGVCAEWQCPEISVRPAAECSCDLPFTIRCAGDHTALQIIGHHLRAEMLEDTNKFISLLDLSLRGVTALSTAAIMQLAGLGLQGLVISSGEIERVQANAFLSVAKSVVALGLPNNQLPGVPIEAIHDMIYLERLDLSNNRITRIERHSFEGLDRLVFLDVSENLIKDIAIESFDPLVNLAVLRLRGNLLSVSSLYSLKGAVKLQGLDLSGNGLSGSLGPNTLPKFLQLTTLQISDNSFDSINKECLHGSPGLTHLDIHNNQVDVLEDYAFVRLENLTHLDLSQNDIVSVSESSLVQLNALTRLDLSHNYLRSLSAEPFRSLTNLSELLLHDNDISIVEDGALALHSNLTKMTIQNNPLNCDCSMSSFARWLRDAKNITEENKKNAVCATPPHLEGALLYQLSKNKLCDDFDIEQEEQVIKSRVMKHYINEYEKDFKKDRPVLDDFTFSGGGGGSDFTDEYDYEFRDQSIDDDAYLHEFTDHLLRAATGGGGGDGEQYGADRADSLSNEGGTDRAGRPSDKGGAGGVGRPSDKGNAGGTSSTNGGGGAAGRVDRLRDKGDAGGVGRPRDKGSAGGTGSPNGEGGLAGRADSPIDKGGASDADRPNHSGGAAGSESRTSGKDDESSAGSSSDEDGKGSAAHASDKSDTLGRTDSQSESDESDNLDSINNPSIESDTSVTVLPSPVPSDKGGILSHTGSTSYKYGSTGGLGSTYDDRGTTSSKASPSNEGGAAGHAGSPNDEGGAAGRAGSLSDNSGAVGRARNPTRASGAGGAGSAVGAASTVGISDDEDFPISKTKVHLIEAWYEEDDIHLVWQLNPPSNLTHTCAGVSISRPGEPSIHVSCENAPPSDVTLRGLNFEPNVLYVFCIALEQTDSENRPVELVLGCSKTRLVGKKDTFATMGHQDTFATMGHQDKIPIKNTTELMHNVLEKVIIGKVVAAKNTTEQYKPTITMGTNKSLVSNTTTTAATAAASVTTAATVTTAFNDYKHTSVFTDAHKLEMETVDYKDLIEPGKNHDHPNVLRNYLQTEKVTSKFKKIYKDKLKLNGTLKNKKSADAFLDPTKLYIHFDSKWYGTDKKTVDNKYGTDKKTLDNKWPKWVVPKSIVPEPIRVSEVRSNVTSDGKLTIIVSIQSVSPEPPDSGSFVNPRPISSKFISCYVIIAVKTKGYLVAQKDTPCANTLQISMDGFLNGPYEVCAQIYRNNLRTNPICIVPQSMDSLLSAGIKTGIKGLNAALITAVIFMLVMIVALGTFIRRMIRKPTVYEPNQHYIYYRQSTLAEEPKSYVMLSPANAKP